MFTRKMTVLASLLAILVGCGGGGSDSTGSTDTNTGGTEICGPAYQKNFVLNTMTDWYLWYDEIPELNVEDFDSNEALLNAIVEPAITARGKEFPYSYLTTVEAEQAMAENAGYVGMGFSSIVNDAGDAILLREVFPDSPAANAGLVRGDAIIAIGGTPVAELLNSGAFAEEPGPYGPNEVGYTVEMTIRHQGGAEEAVDVTKAEVETPTVAYTTTFDANGAKVGYIFFRSFLPPSEVELNEAFAKIAEGGTPSRLILDLRYNGGGYVSIAEHLADLITGGQNAGEIYSKTNFNDKHSGQNSQDVFNTAANSLPITQLIAITTGGTASSSELVINGLDPYIDVVTVGTTSYGKPVGQQAYTFCGKVLRGVSFETVNALDEGDYYSGIAPTSGCEFEDDLTAPLGSANEASIAAALRYVETGSCATSAKPGASDVLRNVVDRSTSTYRDGWDLLTGGRR